MALDTNAFAGALRSETPHRMGTRADGVGAFRHCQMAGGGCHMQLEDDMVANEAGKWWWAVALIGVLWLWIGFIVLRLDLTSITAVGFLIGGMFIAAALDELMQASATRGGWKILHYVLAAVFLLGSLWAFVRPIESVFALASVLGFILLLMGTFDVVRAISTKGVDELWWLPLITGILLILLAVWVSQRFYPARIELILFWVGFMSIFRGIGLIALGFTIRRAGRVLAAA
jgi:uncharacterized membrane protein HdeD (DUF308 family)